MSQNQYQGATNMSKPPLTVMRRNSPFHVSNVLLDSRDDIPDGMSGLPYSSLSYSSLRNGNNDKYFSSPLDSMVNGPLLNSQPDSSIHSKQGPLLSHNSLSQVSGSTPLNLDPNEFPSLATPRNINSGLGGSGGSAWTQVSSVGGNSMSTASLFPNLNSGALSHPPHPLYTYGLHSQPQSSIGGSNYGKNFVNVINSGNQSKSGHMTDPFSGSGSSLSSASNHMIGSSLLSGNVATNGPSEFSIAPEDFPALPSQSQPNTPLPSSGMSSNLPPFSVSSHSERTDAMMNSVVTSIAGISLNESISGNELGASSITNRLGGVGTASSTSGSSVLDIHQSLQRHPSYTDSVAAAMPSGSGSHLIGSSSTNLRNNTIGTPQCRPLLGVGGGGSGASNLNTQPQQQSSSKGAFSTQHYLSSMVSMGIMPGNSPSVSSTSNNTSSIFGGSVSTTMAGPSGLSLSGTTSGSKFNQSIDQQQVHSNIHIQRQQQPPQQQQPQDSSRKMRFLPNGVVENVPTSMLQDEFGLCALGYFIPVANNVMPGEELKEFFNFIGNKDSPSLYQNLQSPLSENFPGRPQDMDWVVPEEYHIRHLFYKQLADLKVSQLSDDTLFWIFYNCCGEEAQAVAAKALYTRGWRYHMKLQIWVMRVTGEPRSQHMGGETSFFSVWDPRECRRVTRRFSISYTELDTPPEMSCDKLPVAATMSLAQVPPRQGHLLSSSLQQHPLHSSQQHPTSNLSSGSHGIPTNIPGPSNVMLLNSNTSNSNRNTILSGSAPGSNLGASNQAASQQQSASQSSSAIGSSGLVS